MPVPLHVSLDSLTQDPAYEVRTQRDWHPVRRYVAALKNGDRFPPVVAGRGEKRDLVLLDGHYRLQAFREVGRPKIGVMPTPAPRSLWFAEAVRLNTVHGVPLTVQDRLNAAIKMRQAKLDPALIEKVVCMTREDLERGIQKRVIDVSQIQKVVIKTHLIRRVGQKGTMWAKENAESIQQHQKVLTGASSTHLVNQVIEMLEQDFFPEGEDTDTLIARLHAAVEAWEERRGGPEEALAAS